MLSLATRAALFTNQQILLVTTADAVTELTLRVTNLRRAKEKETDVCFHLLLL